jgi:hypothetical protein
MKNALRELVLRGAVSMSICALATLFVIGLLSALAENLPSKPKSGADLTNTSTVNAGNCGKAKRQASKLGCAHL